MIGVEALVRWKHSTRGLLAPKQFITIAEACGLIVPIGRWVMREACRQARAWQEQGFTPIPISVNVSALEFRSKGFLVGVATVLNETGLAAEYLEVEVTESILMDDTEATTAVLRALKEMGVRIAIDDFGTGYSSLSYLSRFPIDTLKIDRVFVSGIEQAGHDAAIIKAVIGLGRSLNQRVVAEGVETEQQVALLRRYLCVEGQGFYFSRPVVASQFADLLREEPREPHCALVSG
jgi:EAL domain-containing protein (putative c-di-GMP-specific phosphodiesterase class I)